jgi:TctA family transporter
MVWVIVIANVIAVAVSFLALKQLVKLTFVKGTWLVPFLLVLVTIGAFSVHNEVLDVVTMLVLGAFGWAAIRWGWPRAPFLLAFVLGPTVERYLFLSHQLYEWGFLIRPATLAIIAIAAAGLLYSLRRERATRRFASISRAAA